MRVVPVRQLSDNYAYLLINENTQTSCAVDVSEPAKVLQAAEQERVSIDRVLTTHKHMDHAGGNNKIAKQIANLQIVGGVLDHVQGCTKEVRDGETFKFEDMTIKCLHTPGHTQGHICFYVTSSSSEPGCVFTGDCLFIGGAGRFFEGTGEDMYVSLYEKLGKLPADTQVWCGHEYTASNYKFALTVEPDNAALQSANERAQAVLSAGGMTIPSTIQQELDTNPFMRADQPAVQHFTGLGPSATIAQYLQAVRDMKDIF